MRYAHAAGTDSDVAANPSIHDLLCRCGIGRLELRIDPAYPFSSRLRPDAALAEMVGCAPEELPTTYEEFLQRYLHPEEKAVIWQALRRLIDDGEVTGPIEHRLWHAGDRTWHWVTSAFQVEQTGHISELIQDITESKRDRDRLEAEVRRLRQENARLQEGIQSLATAVELASIGTFTYDVTKHEIAYHGIFSDLKRCDRLSMHDTAAGLGKGLIPEDFRLAAAALQRHLDGKT
ncbi:MAG: PAS domain-containing protein, partial [Planctomycetes bacterium]|nr:PAS domain-containing protein [Planctomycetota bacterium]